MSLKSTYFKTVSIFIFLIPSMLFSQYEDNKDQEVKRFIISTGLGTNFNNGFNGFGGGVILSISSHRFLYSLRVINLDRINTMKPLEDNNIQYNNFTDISFLVGLNKKTKYYLVALNTGLGITSWKKEVNHSEQRKNNICLPISLHAMITPLPFMGFGIYGFSNINGDKSLSGILITLQFGNIW